MLKQALEGARQNIGCCWMLAGEAGIGKSRLVQELKSQAAPGNFQIVQGDCFQQDASLPYAPWIDALRISFASLSSQEILKLIGPFAPELAKLLPELALIVPGLQPTPHLEPAAEKYRTFETLSRLLLSVDAPRPCLIILEDLHWSDSLSLELFHFLSRRTSHLPVVLIGTYRSDEPSPQLEHLLSELDRERLAQELVLRPLNQDNVQEMMRAVARTQQHIPRGVAGALLGLTDGNPLFLEEILKDFTEGDRMAELFQRVNLADISLPRSIRRLEQQRTEQLAEPARRILLLASVIGERLDFGLVRETSGLNEHQLLDALKELAAAHLVVQDSDGQFKFRHALTRQAVYSMLMLPERKAMHQKIGEALERLAGLHRDAAAAQLAYHFYQAGAWDRATQYSQRAGESALSLYAPREAFTHFTRALDAAQHLDPPVPAEMEVRMYRGRAQAREVWTDFDGARADYEAALRLARSSSNSVGEWQTLIDLGLLWQSRDLAYAGEIFENALELARRLGDTARLAQTLNRVGNWHTNRGHAREGLLLHLEALELFRKIEDRRGMAHTMELLGIVNYQLGNALQGSAYLEEALPILRELDDRQALVNTLSHLCMRPRLESEVWGNVSLAELTAQSDEALQVARSFNWYQGEALALQQGAIPLAQAGQYRRALERLELAQSLEEEMRNRELKIRFELILGEVFSGLLALSEARRHLETSLAMAQEIGSGIFMLSATARLASVCVLQKDLARAKELLDGLNTAEKQALAPERRSWSGRAELELAQGNAQGALEIIDRLIDTTANLPQYGRYAVPRLSRLRGEALTALGRLPEAEAELQGTLPVAIAQGQRPILWRLHLDLCKVYRALGRREDGERELASARAAIEELANDIPEGALRDNFTRQTLGMLPAAHVPTPRQATKQSFGGLTAREREIASLIAHGKSNREIADELIISENTAERHVANILAKLSLNSRTQIAVWAVEKGLRQ